jgi:Putative prokaryotic signal transducing protein
MRWATVTDIIEVAQFQFLHEAELAATALQAAGIECAVPDRFGRGRTPQNIFTGETFRLLVAIEDGDRAREILASGSG